jgi:hypothetical protein
MSRHTGVTDTSHVVQLSSAIERVEWTRRRAAPGGAVGLTVRTVFCGDGAPIRLRLLDATGTRHARLSGTLYDNRLRVDLRVPTEAKGGLVAAVSMPEHGCSAESPALQVTEPVRVRGAQWSRETVGRGEAVTMTAETRGAVDGRRARIRIFEFDDSGAHLPVTRMRTRVDRERVEAAWRFEYPGNVTEIVPEAEAPAGYVPPEYFFRVDVGGVTAESGRLAFRDTVTLEHRTAAATRYEAHLADGTIRTGRTDADGRAVLEDVPPGPVDVTWRSE